MYIYCCYQEHASILEAWPEKDLNMILCTHVLSPSYATENNPTTNVQQII